MWEDRLAAVGERASSWLGTGFVYQGTDEEARILLAGFKKALSYAQEAASEADSATTCVVVKSLLRHVMISLARADQCPSNCANALMCIEKAVGLAEVRILATMKFAECKVRDLMAWRAQLCAPVASRCMFIGALRTAWLCLGFVLNDKSLAKILHAHRKEISNQIPWCYPSETQRQSRARGGKIRAARNRPMAAPPAHGSTSVQPETFII
jgi:hypothetical protein